DVLAALAQRRGAKVEHVEPVDQILTEAAFSDQLLQLAVGGAEDAHVDANLAFAADAAEAALAEKVHQLGLPVRRHLGDLVEKHRAAVGQFQQAGLAAALGAAGNARRV